MLLQRISMFGLFRRFHRGGGRNSNLGMGTEESQIAQGMTAKLVRFRAKNTAFHVDDEVSCPVFVSLLSVMACPGTVAPATPS